LERAVEEAMRQLREHPADRHQETAISNLGTAALAVSEFSCGLTRMDVDYDEETRGKILKLRRVFLILLLLTLFADSRSSALIRG
jgi:hypothetical protein